MTREELLKEIIEDPSNSLFGIPLLEVRKMIFEYQTQNVDPYKIFAERIKLEKAVDKLNIQLGEAQTALFNIAEIVLPYPQVSAYTWDDVVAAVKELSEEAWKYKDLSL